jgi:RNA polymerase sigma-70 factor (ECF subfamily)
VIVFRRRGHGAAVNSARRSASEPSAAPAPAPRHDFDDLVSQHLDFVWRLLRRFGASAADADDLAQQVFMIAARKWDELPRGKERAFLYGTARRVAANARRDRGRRAEVSSDALAEAHAPGLSPDEQAELGRAAQLLDELLEQLPEELRRVLVLAELEEATVPAIAQLEEIAEGTAASRLRRARAAFAQLLAGAARRNPFGAGA